MIFSNTQLWMTLFIGLWISEYPNLFNLVYSVSAVKFKFLVCNVIRLLNIWLIRGPNTVRLDDVRASNSLRVKFYQWIGLGKLLWSRNNRMA